MEKNTIILKWGLIIIGFVFGLCLLFMTLVKLDKPVFLEHYYEYPISQLNQTVDSNPQGSFIFKLQYLTNRDDDKEVTGISFKEAPDLIFYATENMYSNLYSTNPAFTYSTNGNTNKNLGQNYGRYCIRTIYVSIDPNSINKNIDELHLSQAIIYFNYGKFMEANIGEIVFNKDIALETLMSSTFTSTSSDGTSLEQFKVDKDITLLEIRSPMINDIKSLEYLKVNGLNYSNIKGTAYKAGEQMEFSSKINLLQVDFTIVEIHPRLIYKDLEGKQYSQRIYLYKNLDYIDFKSILKYLISRGKL